ncbi:MAG: response regulator [Candidatus Protistobacter heckmanni]|nr:response regulator [Candidatus Protistobacter heckmanni]
MTLAKAEKPHLVICDILMPTMDGYEFVHHLHSDPVIRNTEVIFFTASYHGSDAQSLAKALGVSRIVTKPCEPRELMQIISLSLGESALGAASAKVDGLADGLEFFARENLKPVTNKLTENTDQLQRVNHKLTALIELNLALASERDPNALLEKICGSARALVGAKHAYMRISEPGAQGSKVFFSNGPPPEQARRVEARPLDVGFFSARLPRGGTFRFRNAGGAPDAVVLPDGYPGVLSGLVASVQSPQQIYGWIFMADKVGAEEFSEEDRQVLGIHAGRHPAPERRSGTARG